MDELFDVTFESESGDKFFDEYGLRIFRSLRKIIRAVDIHSRKLLSDLKITAPQMICLYTISRPQELTQSQLAAEVDLGASTITGIVDRLEAKGYLRRDRSTVDRRKVVLRITDTGRKVARLAPALLQDRLANSLRQLPETEQAGIASSLERVVEMMRAAQLDGLNVESPEEMKP